MILCRKGRNQRYKFRDKLVAYVSERNWPEVTDNLRSLHLRDEANMCNIFVVQREAIQEEELDLGYNEESKGVPILLEETS